MSLSALLLSQVSLPSLSTLTCFECQVRTRVNVGTGTLEIPQDVPWHLSELQWEMWNVKLSWGPVGNQLRTSEETTAPSSAGPTALLHYCLWEDSSSRPGLLAARWGLHYVCMVTCCPLPEGTVPAWVRSIPRDSFRDGSSPPSVIYSQNKAFLVTLGCAVFSSEDIVRMVVINTVQYWQQ